MRQDQRSRRPAVARFTAAELQSAVRVSMTRLGSVLALLVITTGAPPAAQAPTFEVASIKPSADSRAREGADVEPSGRFAVANTTLLSLIRDFFELERHEMVSGERLPSWVGSERWDIVAKGPPITDVAAQIPIYRRMMQNLLTDRFKLVTRRELRDIPVYALVFARADRRLGPQMRPSSADCAALAAAFKATGARQGPDSPVCGVKPILGQFRGTGVLLSELARALGVSERPVVDATGLTGAFDFELKWTSDNAAGASVGASLFTAIQEQLGLRLEPRQAPMNVLVIESADRPAPD
jgi:uncharacterized protein (TIGR03435 family)